MVTSKLEEIKFIKMLALSFNEDSHNCIHSNTTIIVNKSDLQ